MTDRETHLGNDFEDSVQHRSRHEQSRISSGSTIPASAVIETHTKNGTGPRTLAGKEKSKYNATKHGIFSSVLILKGESFSEYRGLLDGLRASLQPEGILEELLVDKIAMFVWRHRRLIIAEAGEIESSTEFVESDIDEKRSAEAQRQKRGLNHSIGQGHLMSKISNVEVLDRCLDLLDDLKESVKNDGLEQEEHVLTLKAIYGEQDPNGLEDNLLDTYVMWLDTSKVSEEERQQNEYATPEECTKNVSDAITSEIRRLKDIRKRRVIIDTERTRLEIVRRSIPEGPASERLLRYEAILERGFEKALNQLERLQRMRLGQPLPPKIDVTVSS